MPDAASMGMEIGCNEICIIPPLVGLRAQEEPGGLGFIRLLYQTDKVGRNNRAVCRANKGLVIGGKR